MKQILIIATLLCCIVSCSAQKGNNNKKNNNMMNFRTFNIMEFDKKRNQSWKYEYKDQTGMIIKQKKEYERGEKFIGYQEECYYPYSPYIYTYLYNKKGELIFSCTSFYGFPIGKGIKYDSRGLATNSIDYDELYKFDLESLIEKMKKEYNVDLLDKMKIHQLSRFFIKNMSQSFYEIYVLCPNSLTETDTYLIDGTTGKTLLKSKRMVKLEFGALQQETMLEEYKHKYKDEKETINKVRE